MVIDSGLFTNLIIALPFLACLFREIRCQRRHYILKSFLILTFYFYIVLLIKHAIFPIYLGGSMKQIMQAEMPMSKSLSENVNLIPLVRGWYPEDFLLNIIMTLPLGILLPCLIKGMTIQSAAIAGTGIGIGIELIQFFLLILQGFTFRDININDSIANAIGVLIGYVIYIFSVKIFLEAAKNTQIPIVVRIRSFFTDRR